MKRSYNDQNERDFKHASKRWPRLNHNNDCSSINDPSLLYLAQGSNQNNSSNIHSELMRLCPASFAGFQNSRPSTVSTSIRTQWSHPVHIDGRRVNIERSGAGIVSLDDQGINCREFHGSAMYSSTMSASSNISHVLYSSGSQPPGQQDVLTTRASAPVTPYAHMEERFFSDMNLKRRTENLQRQQQQQNEIDRLRREIQQLCESRASISSIIPSSSVSNVSIENFLIAHSAYNTGTRTSSVYQPPMLDRLAMNELFQQQHITSPQAAAFGASLQTRNIFPNALNTGSTPVQVPPNKNRIVWHKDANWKDSKTIIPISLPAKVETPQMDRLRLSDHQILLRQQIEFFEADDLDVLTHIRGRNKSVQYGQVGIRCIHCAHIPVSRRQKGSTYFPSAKLGIYQAAQNMSSAHIQHGLCRYIPEGIKEQFTCINREHVNQSNGGGRPYWADAAGKLGLVDTENHGIRFVRNIPLNAKVINNNYSSGGKSTIE